jgi:predicted RNase H-like HicB family nuclease
MIGLLEMELILRTQIEELPEGLYLATSDELPGLVAHGRTVVETLDIARDVARNLIEAAPGERRRAVPAAGFRPARLHDRGCLRGDGAAVRFSLSRLSTKAESLRIPVRPAGGRKPRDLVQPHYEPLHVLPKHPGTLREGTVRAILRQSGIEPEAFLRV